MKISKINNVHYILNKYFNFKFDIDLNRLKELYKEEFNFIITDEELELALSEIYYTINKIEEVERIENDRKLFGTMYKT